MSINQGNCRHQVISNRRLGLGWRIHPGGAAHTTLPPRSRRDHGRIDMASQDKTRHDLGYLPSCFNCYDKAFIESFWSSLKYELVYHHCLPPVRRLAPPSSTTSKLSATAPNCTPVWPI